MITSISLPQPTVLPPATLLPLPSQPPLPPPGAHDPELAAKLPADLEVQLLAANASPRARSGDFADLLAVNLPSAEIGDNPAELGVPVPALALPQPAGRQETGLGIGQAGPGKFEADANDAPGADVPPAAAIVLTQAWALSLVPELAQFAVRPDPAQAAPGSQTAIPPALAAARSGSVAVSVPALWQPALPAAQQRPAPAAPNAAAPVAVAATAASTNLPAAPRGWQASLPAVAAASPAPPSATPVVPAVAAPAPATAAVATAAEATPAAATPAAAIPAAATPAAETAALLPAVEARAAPVRQLPARINWLRASAAQSSYTAAATGGPLPIAALAPADALPPASAQITGQAPPSAAAGAARHGLSDPVDAAALLPAEAGQGLASSGGEPSALPAPAPPQQSLSQPQSPSPSISTAPAAPLPGLQGDQLLGVTSDRLGAVRVDVSGSLDRLEVNLSATAAAAPILAGEAARLAQDLAAAGIALASYAVNGQRADLTPETAAAANTASTGGGAAGPDGGGRGGGGNLANNAGSAGNSGQPQPQPPVAARAAAGLASRSQSAPDRFA